MKIMGNLRRWFGNLSWGMRFRTCENFWDSADSSVRPKNSYKYKSHTAITSIVVAFSHESKKSVIARFCKAKSWQSTKKINPARSANPIKSFLLLFCFRKKVESSFPYRLQSTKKGRFAESRTKCESNQKFFATFLLSQKSRILFPLPTSIN